MTSIQQLYNRRWGIYALGMDSMRRRSTITALESVLPSAIPSGSHVLDVGSGSGLATGLLHEQYPDAHITALDYADKLLAVLRRRWPQVTVVSLDMNTTPVLSTAPYQVVVSAGAVSEYADIERVLPWLYRNMVPGGTFINVGVSTGLLGRLTGWLWHFKPTSAQQFAAACRAAGFTHVEIISPPPNIFLKHLEEYIVRAVR